MKSAIIPYRKTKNQNIEVLLVQNISGDKWIIPKGNIKKRVSPEISSAIEAYEEAGVLGKILPFSIGQYLKNEEQIPVFMLAVDTELKKYKEQKFRRRKWVTIDKAQLCVKNESLFEIISKAFEVIDNDANYFKTFITSIGKNEPFSISKLTDIKTDISIKYIDKKNRKISIKRKNTKLIISAKSNIKNALRSELFNSIVKERLNNELQNSELGTWKLSKQFSNPKLKLSAEIDMYQLSSSKFNQILKQLIKRTEKFEKLWAKKLVQ